MPFFGGNRKTDSRCLPKLVALLAREGQAAIFQIDELNLVRREKEI
jgi:hypothetical protein